MGAIVGIVIIFAMVFGGYLAAGGKMGIIIKAMPFELMMIGGAAVGAFVLSNDGHTIKHSLGDMKKVFGGAKWHKSDYNDLLCLLYELIRLAQAKPLEVEQHIENPAESDLFSKYPKIQSDKRAMDMICDTFRSSSMNFDDPHQVEDLLEKQLDDDFHEAQHSSHAIQNMADALPALGIVAAVLGVIHTMGSITEPPEVLGHLIGAALVGTFSGVLLSYGFFAPYGKAMQSVFDNETLYLQCMKAGLLAHMQGYAPQVSIEFARKILPDHLRPTFQQLEETVTNLPTE